MRFRITLAMGAEPSTYLVDGWEELKKEVERLGRSQTKFVMAVESWNTE